MDALAESITRSPELFPLSAASGRGLVSFIRLSEAEYRAASFLDARILSPGHPSRNVPWPVVEQAAAGLPEACDFIFHIGHVGSTLLSRFLGANPRLLPLREPAILRTLAQDPAEYAAKADVFFRLWSRSFAPGQRPLIKATSFVSEIAAQILARPSQPKAIFIFTSPETYLATILGGPNSRTEAGMLEQSRFARLTKRFGREPAKPSSEGERIAMGWACEMTALHAAFSAARERILMIDFDKLLVDPQPVLRAGFDHLQIEIADSEIAAIVAGPDMQRYSKAPEHAYDTKLRNEVLNAARAEHGAEIKCGLEWLEKAAGEFPELSRLTVPSN